MVSLKNVTQIRTNHSIHVHLSIGMVVIELNQYKMKGIVEKKEIFFSSDKD